MLNNLVKCKIERTKGKNYGFFKKKVDDSLPAIILRITAKDGFLFNKFCNLKDLRNLMAAKGHTKLLKSSNTIQEIVIKYGEKIRTKVISEIMIYLQKSLEEKFSLTFDEYTSIRNRRYLNVNVHTENTFWNLGLCRIVGSMPAEKCVQILQDKLTFLSRILFLSPRMARQL